MTRLLIRSLRPLVGLRAVAATLLVVTILPSCAKRGRAPEVIALEQAIAEADVAWAERGRRGLDDVETTLEAAWAIMPGNADVAWRLVRLKLAQAFVEPDARASQYMFAEARAVGMACIDKGAPGVSELLLVEGWDAALAGINGSTASCAAWTSLAWAQWVAIHGGEAAALDLVAVEQIAAAAQEAVEPDHVDEVLWARGLLLAVRPSWDGRDLDKARELLERAVDRAPRNVPRKADLLTRVLVPSGDAAAADALRAAIRDNNSRAPEDVAVRERLVGDGSEAQR